VFSDINDEGKIHKHYSAIPPGNENRTDLLWFNENSNFSKAKGDYQYKSTVIVILTENNLRSVYYKGELKCSIKLV
jgi:hypothetical protein